MARVIKSKSNGPSDSTSGATRLSLGARIIDRHVLAAGQTAAKIRADGEHALKQKWEEGRTLIALTKEEAMADAAKEAFTNIAKEIFSIYRERHGLIRSVAHEVEAIALLAVKKIAGEEASKKILSGDWQAKLEHKLHHLQAKSKIRIALPTDHLAIWHKDIPNLNASLKKFPEVEIAESSQLPLDHVRLTVDIGPILCDEGSIKKAIADWFG